MERARFIVSRMDDYRAVETVFDLAAEVGMVPETSVLCGGEFICEGVAWFDGVLGYAWDAV